MKSGPNRYSFSDLGFRFRHAGEFYAAVFDGCRHDVISIYNRPSVLKTIRIAEPPAGFRYADNFIDGEEEGELVRKIEPLPLKEFEFHGYFGKRRTISFGWHYDFGDAALNQAELIPDFLAPLRESAAKFAGLDPNQFPHVLVTEYSPGTPIGW